jgi:hypothetical protein
MHTWKDQLGVRPIEIIDVDGDGLSVAQADPGDSADDSEAWITAKGRGGERHVVVKLNPADRRALIVALGGIVDYGSERA